MGREDWPFFIEWDLDCRVLNNLLRARRPKLGFRWDRATGKDDWVGLLEEFRYSAAVFWGADGACELTVVIWDSEKLGGFGPAGGIDIIVVATQLEAP